MAAEDDPEQRIRDLERALSERVSELGVSSAESSAPPAYIPPRDAYPAPPPGAGFQIPPPPPGAFGAGFPPHTHGGYSPSPVFGAPFQRSSPPALRWLLLVIPVVGIAIAGFTFFAVYQAADDVTSQFSSIQSADPPVGFPAPSKGEGPAPTVARGDSTSVAGVSTREAVVCDGGSVNVSGVSNTVEITGHCANVFVSGVENKVKVESADVISASGFTNRVTFSTGTPQTSAGGDNVIERG